MSFLPAGHFGSNIDRIAYFIVFTASFLIVTDPKSVIYFFFIFFFLAVIRIKQKGLKISPVEVCCSFFLLGILISFVDVPGRHQFLGQPGFIQWTKMLQWIFYPFFIGQFEFSEKKRAQLLIPFGMGLIFYVFKDFSDWHSGHMHYYPRLAGGYAISQFSVILSFYIMVFCSLLLFDKNRTRYGIIWGGAGAIGTILLILTGTRGVWISTVIALGTLFYMQHKKLFLIYGIALVAGGLLFLNLPDNPYSVRLAEALTCKQLFARFEAQREALRLFLNHPVNGVGYENFIVSQDRSVYGIEPFYVHPHNMMLKMLCETGMIGLIGYVILKGGILVTCCKTVRHTPVLMMTVGCMISLEIYELSEIVIRKHHAYAVLFLMLSIVLQDRYRHPGNLTPWRRSKSGNVRYPGRFHRIASLWRGF